ncbi:hypothetical protein F383_33187 [Gossypium arboreum]|uniref:Uncharacterized protein n=1 Tax=Gossypium arboreum TaxID=29729 RepID=A0A0B0N5W2_GOSAR|nr:hypothetical protein F383_33187 [Gossypium arboreum]
MSQTWFYTDYHLVADECLRYVLHWLPSLGRCMPMPCPRHGLTLALKMWPMHVPDMSYTSSHTNDPNVPTKILLSHLSLYILNFKIKQFML